MEKIYFPQCAHKIACFSAFIFGGLKGESFIFGDEKNFIFILLLEIYLLHAPTGNKKISNTFLALALSDINSSLVWAFGLFLLVLIKC
jgi:hypothetical protein